MKKLFFIPFLFLFGCNDPFINKLPEEKSFKFNGQVFNALFLFRSEDQEIGFKNNPKLLPIVFTWDQPIAICFNMKNVNYDLFIYYLDEKKNLVGKDYMVANSNSQYCPPKKISYAIESVNKL